jgi:hypothetical protein
MRQKERQDDRSPSGDRGEPESGLDQVRERAERFLAAGDDAINRALANSDSEAFLRANRQQGGE